MFTKSGLFTIFTVILVHKTKKVVTLKKFTKNQESLLKRLLNRDSTVMILIAISFRFTFQFSLRMQRRKEGGKQNAHLPSCYAMPRQENSKTTLCGRSSIVCSTSSNTLFPIINNINLREKSQVQLRQTALPGKLV